MSEQTSPFLEGKYGWSLGESGWNSGMDENLLKFSYMFDRNIDGIVASLPPPINGKAYFNTTDNRLYFVVNSIYYSSPTPLWMQVVDRLTGDAYQFNGSTLLQIDSPADIDSRLDSIELTITTLGTAAYEDIGFFVTQTELDSFKNTLPSTPYEYGAVGDGIADDTVAMQSFATDTNFKRKRIPKGIFKVSSGIVFNAGDLVEGDGIDSVIDASSSVSWASNAVVSAAGILTNLGALSTNATIGDDNITLVSASGISAGDALIIYNPTASSWSTWRPEYKAGEFVRVHSVSGNNVKLMGLLYDSYLTGAVTVYKIVGKSTVFRDFYVKTPALEGVVGIQFSLIDRPVLQNCWSTGSLYTAFELERCMDISVNTRAFQTQAPTNDEYGLTIANCHGGTIDGVFNSGRHGVALGGWPYVGSVTNRAITIRAASMGNNAPIGAQDMHGNCEDITFIGGTFNAGVSAGKNIHFIGCNFRSKQNNGIALYMGEVIGGYHIFDSCTFESFTDPNLTGYGTLTFDNFSANVAQTCRYMFNNCFFKASSSGYIVRIRISGTTNSHTFIFNGVEVLDAALSGEFLRLTRTSGSSTIERVSIKNIGGLNSGVAYVTNAGTGLSVNKYTLPSQTGSVSISPTVGTATASSTVTFTHPYPIAPTVLTGKQGSGAGGKTFIANSGSITPTGFSATAVTADGTNYTTTAAGIVPWFASLDQQ